MLKNNKVYLKRKLFIEMTTDKDLEFGNKLTLYNNVWKINRKQIMEKQRSVYS